MIATSSQVFVCGCPTPPPRDKRSSAAERNAMASPARMNFAATPHDIFARSRCCRQAGALVLNNGVPGSSRQRYCAARIR
jgi:hypothetical protein